MLETYVITFHLKPGMEARFRELLDPVLDAMRHENTFVYAALHVNPELPDVFQLHRPYRAKWHAALDDLLARPRQIEIWRALRADARKSEKPNFGD
nr:antibiotic biosynthesis monooxygenase [uncultured Nitratireductor sp.]